MFRETTNIVENKEVEIGHRQFPMSLKLGEAYCHKAVVDEVVSFLV